MPECYEEHICDGVEDTCVARQVCKAKCEEMYFTRGEVGARCGPSGPEIFGTCAGTHPVCVSMCIFIDLCKEV